jgi:ABC-type multidrug transport system ATPase subunit
MEHAIEIRDLKAVFTSRGQTVTALDGLSLNVGMGKVFGFLGPNGAGKTTTMHVLLGFVRPTAGEARLLGEDVRKSIARQRIGYLPENPSTYRFLTGRELLKMAGHLFGLRGATNYFALTYQIFGDIVKSQYPSLLPSYEPAAQVTDLSYLKTLSQEAR